MKKFVNDNKNFRMVVLDVPLLIENKLNLKSDILIFINSKRNKIYSRLKKRRNFDHNLIKSLSTKQTMLSKKKKIADYIIDNNFSPNIMKKKVKLLKKKILNERSST